jgi:hypothetical protein
VPSLSPWARHAAGNALFEGMRDVRIRCRLSLASGSRFGTPRPASAQSPGLSVTFEWPWHTLWAVQTGSDPRRRRYDDGGDDATAGHESGVEASGSAGKVEEARSHALIHKLRCLVRWWRVFVYESSFLHHGPVWDHLLVLSILLAVAAVRPCGQ